MRNFSFNFDSFLSSEGVLRLLPVDSFSSADIEVVVDGPKTAAAAAPTAAVDVSIIGVDIVPLSALMQIGRFLGPAKVKGN